MSWSCFSKNSVETPVKDVSAVKPEVVLEPAPVPSVVPVAVPSVVPVPVAVPAAAPVPVAVPVVVPARFCLPRFSWARAPLADAVASLEAVAAPAAEAAVNAAVVSLEASVASVEASPAVRRCGFPKFSLFAKKSAPVNPPAASEVPAAPLAAAPQAQGTLELRSTGQSEAQKILATSEAIYADIKLAQENAK